MELRIMLPEQSVDVTWVVYGSLHAILGNRFTNANSCGSFCRGGCCGGEPSSSFQPGLQAQGNQIKPVFYFYQITDG